MNFTWTKASSTIESAYHKFTGRELNKHDLHDILRAIPTYRALARRLQSDPGRVCRLMFAEKNTYSSWHHPCDVSELRYSLSSGVLQWHAPMILFSPKTALSLVPEYPVCLEIDRPAAARGVELGGVLLLQSSRLNLRNSVKRILVRDYLSKKQLREIESISRETLGNVPVNLMTGLPGLDPVRQREIRFRRFASLNNEESLMQDSVPNWYGNLKVSYGPSETFHKNTLIGEQPKLPDPDVYSLKRSDPSTPSNFERGDRVAYRYTNVRLPSSAETRDIPMTRSMTQQPPTGVVVGVDEKHIHVRWHNESKIQRVPVRAGVFLVKVPD